METQIGDCTHLQQRPIAFGLLDLWKLLETAPPAIVSIVIPQPTISSPPLGSSLLSLPAGMDPQTNLHK